MNQVMNLPIIGPFKKFFLTVKTFLYIYFFIFFWYNYLSTYTNSLKKTRHLINNSKLNSRLQYRKPHNKCLFLSIQINYTSVCLFIHAIFRKTPLFFYPHSKYEKNQQVKWLFSDEITVVECPLCKRSRGRIPTWSDSKFESG